MNQLNDVIQKYRTGLHTKLNRSALMHAIAQVESNHGERGKATLHEPAYCYGGFYYRSINGDEIRELSKTYGCLAHSSYSSWQIMYISAYDVGFRGDPCDLRNDDIACPVVVRYLNARILDKYPGIGVQDVADAYNSGRPFDDNKPVDYIEKFVASYEDWRKRLRLL